jgi:hypothetical protein
MSGLVIFSNVLSTNNSSHLCVASWNDFLSRAHEPSGFWIDASWDGDQDRLALDIRQSDWWERLAFTENPCSNPLLDGQISLADAVVRCDRAQLAKASLKVELVGLIPAERLLLFMYIRGKYFLIPRYDQNSKRLYVYPLVEVLGGGEADVEWFARLTRSQLLSPELLYDRIRVCRECGSGHLSYVDICPSCSSIHIKHTPSLHCFTCGHTSRKADFEVDGKLVCPKCEMRLRHIGVDYDLPMAQFLCRKCHNSSMEARIVASCFDCKHIDDPDKLDVNEIFSYALNSRGLEALRQGHIYGSADISDGGINHVLPAYFKQLLLWAAMTYERYTSLAFSVFLIEFTNTDELLARLGSSKVYKLIDEFTLRLREVVRSSDVTSVDTADRLWLLLPFNTPDDTEARLREKTAEIQPSNGPALEIRLKIFHAPRDMAKGDDSDAIMTRLLEN